MMNRALLSAIVLGFAVVGCDSLKTPGPPKVPACKGGNHCQVDVDVTGSGSTCRVTKTPDKLYVARNNKEKITWKLPAGSPWAFVKVEFTDPRAPFQCRAQGPHYECDDDNPEKTLTPFAYKITLKNDGATCANDPMIVNGADDSNVP